MAQTALNLEPNYVAALFFMQRSAGSPADDPAFQKRITRIQAKAKNLPARPGSYLYELYRLPAKSKAPY
jgi:hypothetical protein